MQCRDSNVLMLFSIKNSTFSQIKLFDFIFILVKKQLHPRMSKLSILFPSWEMLELHFYSKKLMFYLNFNWKSCSYIENNII